MRLTASAYNLLIKRKYFNKTELTAVLYKKYRILFLAQLFL